MVIVVVVVVLLVVVVAGVVVIVVSQTCQGCFKKLSVFKKKVFLISYNCLFIFVKRTTSDFKPSHHYTYI